MHMLQRRRAKNGRTFSGILGGALLGVLVLHPVTMVIYWFEFHQSLGDSTPGLLRFLATRMWLSFTPEMLPMSGLFAALGSGAGALLVGFQRALSERDRSAQNLREELAKDLSLIIAGGETERIEFKSSVRWDYGMKSVNRKLEAVAAKTIAGFLNASGGNLLLGVDDEGQILGLEQDFRTLKRPDRDGYEQYLMGLVRNRLGGDLCPLIHLAFSQVDLGEVCRVVVEAAPRPVLVEEAGTPKLYIRMGNSTRQLDVHEAIDYVARRWP